MAFALALGDAVASIVTVLLAVGLTVGPNHTGDVSKPGGWYIQLGVVILLGIFALIAVGVVLLAVSAARAHQGRRWAIAAVWVIGAYPVVTFAIYLIIVFEGSPLT
ncbi:hypothetical protein [Mesorhizobium japonicum]|uniref:hypothetical protein n=1 Tax=Mesorhizobium japonicum TaxID=2066070 RepID=UPI003B59010E